MRTTAGIAAGAAILYSSFLLNYLLPGSGLGSADYVSELEGSGMPYAHLFRATDVGAGLLLITLAIRLDLPVATWRRAMMGLAAVGLSSVIDGLTVMPCAQSADCLGEAEELWSLHSLSGVVGVTAIALTAAQIASRRSGPPGLDRIHAWVAIGVGLLSLLELGIIGSGHSSGLLEQFRIIAVSAWFVAVPFSAPHSMSMNDGRTEHQLAPPVVTPGVRKSRTTRRRA